MVFLAYVKVQGAGIERSPFLKCNRGKELFAPKKSVRKYNNCATTYGWVHNLTLIYVINICILSAKKKPDFFYF